MEPKKYELMFEGFTWSKAKLLRYLFTKDYIEGQIFEGHIKITNIGKFNFPGGSFRLWIDFPDGRNTFNDLEIKPTEVKNSTITDKFIHKAMARGYALFTITHLRPKDKQLCLAYNSNHIVIYPTDYYERPALHTFRAKAPEEIYEFWGFILSAFGLAIIAGEKVIRFLKWLLPLLSTYL